jgi:hypothetical protein
MEREVRIANTKKRFREIYDSFRKDIPESKHVMEVAEWMDPLMDELLGRTK